MQLHDAVAFSATLGSGEAEDALSPPGRLRWGMPLLLSMLSGLAVICTYIYTLSLVEMAPELHARDTAIRWTITVYILALILGQPVWGLLGDRWGRKLPAALGLAAFGLGSAGCALARDMSAIAGWRAVQGFGIGASIVMARAAICDVAGGRRLAQAMAVPTIAMTLAPEAASALGEAVLRLSSWRLIFWFSAGIALLAFAVLALLRDPLLPQHRNRRPMFRAFADWLLLLGDRRLLAYAGAIGFTQAALQACSVGASHVFIAGFKMPWQLFHTLWGVGILGSALCTATSACTLPRATAATTGADRWLQRGACIAAAVGILLAICIAQRVGDAVGPIVMHTVFIASTGFILANALAGAMALHPQRAGAIAGLIGTIQFGSGVLGRMALARLAGPNLTDNAARSLGFIIAGCAVGALLCALAIRRRRTEADDGLPSIPRPLPTMPPSP